MLVGKALPKMRNKLLLLAALLLLATTVKADTLLTVTGDYPLETASGPSNLSFYITFEWNPVTLSVVPGTMNVSVPLVFSNQDGDFLQWQTPNWSLLGTFVGYDVEIGCFYSNCGAFTSNNWSIPGNYNINDMRFVYSYIGGWTDEEFVCGTCNVNVSDTPEPSVLSMILVGIGFLFLGWQQWRRHRHSSA